MVQNPYVSSKSGLAPLPASARKALQVQTGDNGNFASLLDGKSGNAEAAARAVHAASAASPRLPEGNGQQVKAAAEGSSGKPSNASEETQATGSQLSKGEYYPFTAGALAFSSSSFRAKGMAGTASTKQSSQPAGEANAPGLSEPPAETIAPASQIGAILAVTASQFPNAQKTQADAGQGTAGADVAPSPTAAFSGSRRGVNPGPAKEREVAKESQAQANTTAPASANYGAGAPVGQAQAIVPQKPQPPESLQGTLAPPGGPPNTSSTQQEIASSSGAPAKRSAESAVAGVTVTEVQTHFVPEEPAETQALKNAVSSSESSPPADLGTLGECSSAAEAVQSVKTADNPSSRDNGPSGQTPAPADEQAAQSPAVNAAQAVPPTGQIAPSPMQQVFNAIQSATATPAEAGSAAAMANPSAPASYQPLKTITIAFQPDGLGTVAIQLSLNNSQLGVRLEASETSTAHLLRQHDGDLMELLQSAGYAVDSVAVHAASQPASAETASQAGASGQNAFNMPHPGGGGGGTGREGAANEGEARRQPNGRNEQRESGYGRPESVNSDRSLYI